MKLMGKAGVLMGAIGAMVVVQAASGQVIETPPGISAFPFAGAAAGRDPLMAPEFGLIDAPGGAHGGDMFIATVHFQDVMRIDPTGEAFRYTELFGTLGGAFGLDIDGPIASLPRDSWWGFGWYGGPSTMTVAALSVGPEPPALIEVSPGGRWEWERDVQFPGSFWMGQLQIDRTGAYGGLMYIAVAGTGIFQVAPDFSWAWLWASVPVKYFAFDLSGGDTGFGGLMWASWYSGEVFAISPTGQAQTPLAVLGRGTAGLAFGPGDPRFGDGLYGCNRELGAIDVISAEGTVTPFARGLDTPAFPMFVTQGPFARNGRPTLYVLCRNDVWMFLHCPGDVDDDSKVDFADYLMFLKLFDLMDPRADLNRDDQVDFCDYLVFLNAYGAGC